MRIIGIATVLCGLIACGGKHPGVYEAGVATGSQTAVDTILGEAADHWAARDDETRLEQALTLYEKALSGDSYNRIALERLTRGWYFWGDAFTTDKDLQLERWSKAIGFGSRCMALNGEIAQRIQAGEKERDAVASATITDVPCIYWMASALGKWGKAQSISTTLKHLPTVKAYIAKVEELDPEYWHYGPARYWGAYYAAIPSFAGRDLELSKKYFETSLQGAPDYLGTYVLRAEFNAVAAQDAPAFLQDLYKTLATDPWSVEGIGPENTREQGKARDLLARKAELFDRDDLEAALAQHPEPVFPAFARPAEEKVRPESVREADEPPSPAIEGDADAETKTRPAPEGETDEAGAETKERPAEEGNAP